MRVGMEEGDGTERQVGAQGVGAGGQEHRDAGPEHDAALGAGDGAFVLCMPHLFDRAIAEDATPATGARSRPSVALEPNLLTKRLSFVRPFSCAEAPARLERSLVASRRTGQRSVPFCGQLRQ